MIGSNTSNRDGIPTPLDTDVYWVATGQLREAMAQEATKSLVKFPVLEKMTEGLFTGEGSEEFYRGVIVGLSAAIQQSGNSPQAYFAPDLVLPLVRSFGLILTKADEYRRKKADDPADTGLKIPEPSLN